MLDALKQVDANTARAFVTAARHILDALLIEQARVRDTQSPPERDYASAGRAGGSVLSRSTMPGGWIANDELRQTTQQLSEAIAAEKWVDGVMFAIRALGAIGAL